jgi:metal-dependent hydrolase (beta-lactamase superfamily II)
MKISTLIENIKDEKSANVKAENGISLIAEFKSQKLLFDTGASSLISANAKNLNHSLKI